ncbi:MAG: endo-1,4-beta-xylanase [Microcystaceae cyanobacterium]
MIPRRRFLEFTTGLTLFPLLHHKMPPVAAQSTSDATITIKGTDFQGNPLDEEGWKSLYFLDLEESPLLTPQRQVKNGDLISSLPTFPVIISMVIPVYGFGRVYLYADNQGKGYKIEDFPLNLPLELARTRLHRIQTFIDDGKSEGYTLPSSITTRLHRGKVYLRNAENSPERTQQVKWCQESLYETLWAGEEAVLAKARYDIAKRGKRPQFKFGCNFFGFPYAGEDYNNYFAQLFNYATVPLYWRSFERERGKRDYENVDNMLDWLGKNQIKAKGHPLVWFAEYGIPYWLEDTAFTSMKGKIEQHIETVTTHFGDRLPYYDVINEGSGLAFANVPGYSSSELVELSRVASTATHQGNKNAYRVINNCCLWAKYRTLEETNPDTPYQYVKACLAANVPFEAIGLQLYYPNHDLLEINRMLERFGQLGKPVHITELGVPSDTEEDENSFMKIPFGLWHKPWSETIQADWIEQFYTLCYSKSYIEAITWWDFSDSINHFWAHGGLLNTEGQPKESFYRLKALLEQWKSL